ncbi:hypothetical protein [Filimonas effusa]|uniref:DUF4397 domain-containing protein n=1 Tax=Filimonas effusa TaxID=2508721 RepID=A0A4Q1DAX6_9BACT|nr:hypothetical protein [Filimonas effusa]RXK86572.1 hypothetical protein ESB13_07135 [Filimonas effusa]
MFLVKYKNTPGARYLGTAIMVACIMWCFTACKKEMPEEIFPASLTLVNAINDNASFLNFYFGETEPKSYGRLVYAKSGESFDYVTNKMDQPVSLFRNYDTSSLSKRILQTRVQLESGGIFTHFIYGSPSNIQQKTIKENLPSRSVNDSVVNLRIINLFENRAIDVEQLEPLATTMASNIAYEQLTGFIKIPVTASVQQFRFAVKDHATGATLATFTEGNILPGATTPNLQWLFKARTMLVTGTWGNAGSYSAKITTIGHF